MTYAGNQQHFPPQFTTQPKRLKLDVINKNLPYGVPANMTTANRTAAPSATVRSFQSGHQIVSGFGQTNNFASLGQFNNSNLPVNSNANLGNSSNHQIVSVGRPGGLPNSANLGNITRSTFLNNSRAAAGNYGTLSNVTNFNNPNVPYDPSLVSIGQQNPSMHNVDLNNTNNFGNLR